jgi:hypothetical protein
VLLTLAILGTGFAVKWADLLLRSTAASNLLGLMACRTVAAACAVRAPGKAWLPRHSAASAGAPLGHIRYHLGGLPGAVRHYAGGLQLLPGDAALR